MSLHRFSSIPAMAIACVLASACSDEGSSSRPYQGQFQPVQPGPTAPVDVAPGMPTVVNPNPLPPAVVAPTPVPSTPEPAVPTGVTPTATPTTPETPAPTPPPPATPEPTPAPAPTPAEPTCAGTGDAVIPQVESGWFPANSNKSCFQGAWYCFDDGEYDTTCVADTAPWDAAKSAMCLTGSTVERVDPDDYTAWGAGIGASLNDQGGKKGAFDAESAGIVGFKFTVAGDLDGATLLFLVPRTNGNSEDGPPEFTAKVGANTALFSNIVQPDWAGTKGPNTSSLYELKWQIKGGDTTSSYSFCITDVEPIYE